jgi:predicted PurR-regulated permease PerM
MNEFYRRSFLIFAAAILGFAVWQVLTPFWGALAWSICLAVLLAPLHERLTQRFGNRPAASAALLTLLTPFVIFAPLAFLGGRFVAEVRLLIDKIQHGPWRIDGNLMERIGEYPVIGPALEKLLGMFDLDPSQLTGHLVSAGQGLLRFAADLGGSLVISALNTTVAFMMMLFLLFFMLRDGEHMLRRCMNLVPIEATHRDELRVLIANTTRAVVFGSGVTAIVQGLLTGLGFLATGLPSPVVFGVLAALFSLLPAGGTAFVWIPATLALAGMGRTGAATFMLAWGIFISISDNFLRPLLVSARAHVSTLAVFVGVIGGATAFGGVGLIIGPVLLTLVSALLRFIEEKSG